MLTVTRRTRTGILQSILINPAHIITIKEIDVDGELGTVISVVNSTHDIFCINTIEELATQLDELTRPSKSNPPTKRTFNKKVRK